MRDAAAPGRSVEIFGTGSKRLMGGPVASADVRISTSEMKYIRQYEPRDLTISVEAGIRYAELSRELARNGQMIPLAGPYSGEATIGGIVAANIHESRRRGYGTARDLVIGMEFATLQGKLVRSGGMVVKNVAGLDMAKLMIGSFGTLAAIATVNFKLLPVPTVSRTLILEFEALKPALELLQAATKAGLNPVAADILNPILAARFGAKGYVLALQFGGNDAVIERSTREISALPGERGQAAALTPEEEARFWTDIAAVTPAHLEKYARGVVVRLSTPISETGAALESIEQAGHAMAASGVVRAWFTRPDAAQAWLEASVKRGWKGAVEFAAEGVNRSEMELWPGAGGDFEIMKKIKSLFDPEGQLNRGRLYGRL